MVDGDTDSKPADSNVNHKLNAHAALVERRANFSLPTNEPDHTKLPHPKTQIPGQFNYHHQEYKQIPDDTVDNNRPNVTIPTTVTLSAQHLLGDDKKQYALKNGNGGYTGEKMLSSNTPPNSSRADFERAIELTGYGKFHYLLLAICGLVSTSEEMDVISMSFILPSAQCDLDLNTQTKGWLNSIIFIGMMVGAYVWGSIADTMGRRKVLIVISFMNAVCIVASSFSQTYLLFMIFRFLNGVA